MTRTARQNIILELIKNSNIETQDELAERLANAGVLAAQATISRDIKELGLIKANLPNGRQKYARPTGGQSLRQKALTLFREVVLSVDYALHTVVIKTLPGSASAAGLTIDQLENAEILGCTAGDNTMIVVARNEMAAKNLTEYLIEILYGA